MYQPKKEIVISLINEMTISFSENEQQGTLTSNSAENNTELRTALTSICFVDPNSLH